MGIIIGWFFIGVLGVTWLVEAVRYRRAAHAADAMPYPGRRLARRGIIAALLAGSTALVLYWPARTPALHLTCLAVLLTAMLTALVLLWRDLRETGRQVVTHIQQADHEAGEMLAQWLVENRLATRADTPPQNPTPEHKPE